jgi:hypothetical protein
MRSGTIPAGISRSVSMLDSLFLAAGAGFFAAALFYTHICDRI